MKKSTSRVWLGIRLTVSICFLKENVKCKKTIQNWKPTRCRAPSVVRYQADGVNLAVNRAAAHSQGHTSSPIPPSLPSLPSLQAGFSEGKGGRREGVMDGRADGSAWHRFVTSSHQLLHPSSSSVKRFQSGKDSLQSGAPLPKDGTQNRSFNKKWGRQFLVFRWGGTLGLIQLTMELSRLRCKRLSWNLLTPLFRIWSQPVGLQVFTLF